MGSARDPLPFLRRLLDAALDAADPAKVLPPRLPPAPRGKTIVIGAGKAAAKMARAVEDHWPGPLSGLIVTRYGHAVPCRRIEVVEAAHPVPDAAGQAAAKRILAMMKGLGADDLVICLLSGGASAVLALPIGGITLEDKQYVTRELLRSGATISEINCVRKHLSAVKGGRLAAAAFPAPMMTFAISDVPGDDPAVIGSGPTVADPTTFADARRILTRYAISPPAAVASHLHRSHDETPKPGDPRLAHASYHIIATPREALDAAAKVARDAGMTPVMLGDAIEGEAREVANRQAAQARQSAPGTVLLSGGETTVTVRGKGRGGRNTEFLLALALALNGAPNIYALAADTDGTDGTEDNAGAFIGPDTLIRARFKGLDPAASLADNDAWSAFAALDDLLVTGPTFTNVNDFRAIVITGGD
ncbi:MAG TPA: glycerate kinase [Stellaceae bacterium]|nr:glycerate kinase [Stellaceae bacterium]